MATRNTASKTDAPSVEDLAAQLDTLRGDIAHLTELMGDYGKDRVNKAGATAQKHAADLRARAEHDAERLQAQANEFAHDAEAFMRERPATTLGMAAALGFLVGILTSRR
ncbi:DUF883 family protein [Qingshengfaniella alkalisoli]|nr:DUF883 family protein [Qingshengfaniella alkalisoli]